MSVRPGPAKVATVIGQLAQGGTEKQLYLFLKHCDRERWAPMVYVSRGPLGVWDDPIRDLGIPVILLQGGPLRRMWQFRQSCRAHGVQRFFSWAAHANAYGLALWGLGVPGIGSFRNEYSAEVAGKWGWLRPWASLAGVNTIVCNSQETADAVRRRAGSRKRVVYIPNCVQRVENKESHRRLWRECLGIRDDEVLVMGVGRLAPQKNFGRFVEAVSLVHRMVPIRAVVAGRDDGCLASLEQQVKLLGLEGVIRFIGPVPDARELVCAADILVLSSDHEGMPNVVLEAMVAGVPCVCTSVSGVSDLVQSGVNGFIADLRADALADGIQHLARDEALRREMGERAGERIGRSFAPSVIAAQLWRTLE